MTYTKKTWTETDVLTLADLEHLDGQYDEISTDLAAHIITGHPTVYRPATDMDQYFWHAENDGDGSTLDADTLDGSHAEDIVGGVDSGIMVWWYPENGDVPDGFLFCDGSNGTMDMRNRFPIGASETISVNEEIGNSQITPVCSCTVGACTLTLPQIFHSHYLVDYHDYDLFVWTGDDSSSPPRTTAVDGTGSTSSAGGGGSHTHPGSFTGDAKSLDPLFTYLVIIQKS
jgi:hypothetical protein